MTTALYTKIDVTGTDLNEAQVIKRAHALGFEMVKFAGWSGSDFTDRESEVNANGAILKAIANTFDRDGVWPPSIFQVDLAEAKRAENTCMEEEDAQAALSYLMRDGDDI